MAQSTYWASLGLTVLRNPAGRAGTQPTGCLSAPARTFAAPAPWGWLGGFAMQGSASDALSTIRLGGCPPSRPMRKESLHQPGRLPNQHLQYAPAPRGPRPPSGAKSSCFRRARGEKVFFGLRALSSERRCCSEQTSCSGCRDRLVAPTEMRRDHEPSQVSTWLGGSERDFLLLILCTQIAPTRR